MPLFCITKLDHHVPSEMRSFLLDAGALQQLRGWLDPYWAANADTDFAHLIKDVNDEQLALISTMKAGTSYVDYHIQFHQRIAKLLRKHQIVKRHERRGDGRKRSDRTLYAARYRPPAGSAGS